MGTPSLEGTPRLSKRQKLYLNDSKTCENREKGHLPAR